MCHENALAFSGTEMRAHDPLPRRMEVGRWLVKHQDPVGIAGESLGDHQRLFDSGARKVERPCLGGERISAAGEYLDLDGNLRRLPVRRLPIRPHLEPTAGSQLLEEGLDTVVADLGALITVLKRVQPARKLRFDPNCGSRAPSYAEVPEGPVKHR